MIVASLTAREQVVAEITSRPPGGFGISGP